MDDFTGKAILITGGASGIGLAVARRFAAAGGRVLLADLDPRGEAVARELAAAGGDVAFRRVDVTADEQVAAMVAAALARFGRLDVFVHAAAILQGAFQSVEELEVATWTRVLTINVTGTFLCARHAAAPLERSRGVFIAFSSGAGVRGPSSSLPYGASKAAVNGFIMTLAPQFAARGIRTHVLCPGALDTPMKRQNILDGAAARSQPGEEALRTADLADPDGLARLVLFLAADEGGYVQGAVHTR